MSNPFVEVDEALKQERLEKLWNQYGGFIVGFLALLILGTAAYEGYKAWLSSKNMNQTRIFLETVQTDNPNAQTLIEVSQTLDAEFKYLTQLRAAGKYADSGDYEEARRIYADVSKNIPDSNATLKDMAEYLAAHLQDNSEETREAKQEKLNEIASDEQNPWRFHARLDLAVFAANHKKDYVSARSQLTPILGSDAVPDTLKQKAQSLDILYAAKQTGSE